MQPIEREVSTQGEMEQALRDDVTPVLTGDGTYQLRGVERVVVRGTSSPLVVVWESTPRLDTYDTSSPRVEAHGMSTPRVWANDASSPRMEG